MGDIDRFYDQPREYVSFDRPKERVLWHLAAAPTADMRGGNGAVLELVYQAAEVVKAIENQAIEAQKTSYQQLQFMQRRIEELETELRAAQLLVSEARTKLKESEEVARAQTGRLEAAEKKTCQLEMRARTAEAKARENADAVARIEEAIRTQILEKRLPINKLTLSA
jgi:hypothetical protein